MEYETRQGTWAQFGEASRAAEPCEGLRIAQGHFLDELPGAVFAAITLIWIVASFAGLEWRLEAAAMMARVHQLMHLAMAPPHSVTIVSRVATAGGFVKRAYGFIARRSAV
jgi:hypothetical protein